MDTANKPTPAPPKIERDEDSFNWRRPQFRVATLLGLLTVVAAVCAIGAAMPSLLNVAFGLFSELLFIVYPALLVTHIVLRRGNMQLFCIVALAVLWIRPWLTSGVWDSPYWRRLRIEFWGVWLNLPELPSSVGYFISSLEPILASLFGGWVALRAARYWQPDDSNSTS